MDFFNLLLQMDPSQWGQATRFLSPMPPPQRHPYVPPAANPAPAPAANPTAPVTQDEYWKAMSRGMEGP